MYRLENTRILAQEALPSPAQLHARVPVSADAAATVRAGREALENILQRRDPRLFVVVGPCSIHDPRSAIEYAERLRSLAARLQDTLLLVMRVYFEKPRTTIGWKGLINDPHMDDSFDIPEGLLRARELMVRINALGLPVGTEALDPLTPQYLGDLVSWNAIGARTTESQTHREMASGLSTPVGFKNGTDGSLQVAVNAMQAAAHPHSFLGVDVDGRASLTRTSGNPYGHLILRGGSSPNYAPEHVQQAAAALRAAGLPENIVVDCSHGNSSRQFVRQALVLAETIDQVCAGDASLVGAMLESHLVAGAQKIPADLRQLTYGQSVTDACLGWDDTERALSLAAGRLARTTRPGRTPA